MIKVNINAKMSKKEKKGGNESKKWKKWGLILGFLKKDGQIGKNHVYIIWFW